MTEEFEVDDDLRPIDPGRILCAHADRNGEGAHWKMPGEPCCEHEPLVSDEGGPVFCRKCQWPA